MTSINLNRKSLIGLIVVDALAISGIMGYSIHLSSQWAPPFLLSQQFIWGVLNIAWDIFWMLVGGLLVLASLWERTRNPQGVLQILVWFMAIIPFPALVLYVTLGVTKNGFFATGAGLSSAIVTASLAIYSKLR